MKIIQPAHNKPAVPCTSWKEVLYEAGTLRKFMREAKFEGLYKKAYAISHAQVSHDPLQLFVVAEDYKNGEMVKWFGSWCVMNVKIRDHEDPVYWDEACMSFPHRKPKRTDRWNKITVEYYIPFLWTWRKIRRKLKGLPAFLVQHELSHALGENIYGLK